MSKVEHLIETINKGGQPNTIGLVFTETEASKIKNAISVKKSEYDNYYENCIKPRIAK